MLKLLIVDDDPGIREGLALGLSDSFEIDQAPGGQEALEHMELGHPDVVLLDQNMKGFSGTRVLESMGAHGHAPAVVMFSATMDVSLVRRALKLGAQDCVAKPFLLDELRNKLEFAAKSRGPHNAAPTPFTLRVADLLNESSELKNDLGLESRRKNFARDLINEALLDTEGDIERAADRLGIDVAEFNSAFKSANRGEHS